ncbi:MAG: hypothetical protein ACI9R7_001369 [Lysobacterales bacterium]|jgi:hypothetical protein
MSRSSIRVKGDEKARFKYENCSSGTNPVYRLLIAATLMACGMSTATAEASESGKFGISLGVFVADRDSQTRIDGQDPASGTPIDLEDDLGFDKSISVFRVDGYYKFNENHRLDFSVFDLFRSASKQIQKDIEWDGELYPIDTSINASADLNIYKLAYTWSFLQRESGYLGVTAGLYVADVGTAIAAESIAQSSSSSVTAPHHCQYLGYGDAMIFPSTGRFAAA